MEPLTSATLIKALDGLSLRMTAIAQNVANAGSPRYRPVHVSFEAALKRAATMSASAVDQVQPLVTHTRDNASRSDVRLDLELADSAMTKERYGAVAELLARELQIDDLVLAGARS